MAEFSAAEAHVISPQKLEADGFRALILAFAVTFCFGAKFSLGVLEIQEGEVDLACSEAAESKPRG